MGVGPVPGVLPRTDRGLPSPHRPSLRRVREGITSIHNLQSRWRNGRDCLRCALAMPSGGFAGYYRGGYERPPRSNPAAQGESSLRAGVFWRRLFPKLFSGNVQKRGRPHRSRMRQTMPESMAAWRASKDWRPHYERPDVVVGRLYSRGKRRWNPFGISGYRRSAWHLHVGIPVGKACRRRGHPSSPRLRRAFFAAFKA